MKTIFTLLSILFFSIAYSQTSDKAGTLDYSFGDSGKVISRDFGGCHFMALQQDNKIVCGATLTGIGFRLVRYFNNGTIDSSFGEQGFADIATTETFPELDGIQIQDDQKIVMGGYGYKNGVPTFIVTRCLPD
ncbi:MAG TPA: delta-60 repeat domain-containing protein, partial [Parafilimonas sp.]